MRDDWVGLFDTSLRYYLGIDPTILTDEQWCNEIAQLAEIRKRDKVGGV